MERLNSASMSDDHLDSCIIHCERMLEEIGDAEIHLNPDASLSALYSSIDFLPLCTSLSYDGNSQLHKEKQLVIHAWILERTSQSFLCSVDFV